MNLNTQPVEKPDRRADGSVDLHSIFYTIQGEGPFTGRPAVFIRLAGCNLQCPWCFGWSNKQGREPFLSMARGPKKKMGQAEIGDEILTFDPDGNLTSTTITNILKRKVDRWLRIQIAGTVYQVTHEHPFFTNRGMVPASELVVGDEILHAEPRDVISWKKQGDRNPIHDSEVMARKLAATDYAASGRKVAAAIARRKEAGLHWGPVEFSPEARERISEANAGSRNGNATVNTPDNFLRLRRDIRKGKIATCSHPNCQTPDSRLEVHHKDGDHTNDDPDNLEVLCHACHSKEHERGYNFWLTKERADRKELVLYTPGRHAKAHRQGPDAQNGKLVESIKEVAVDWDRRKSRPSSPGPEPLEVMNISCHPHNTYLADGMWVHNCDTEYTNGRRRASPQEILKDPAFVNLQHRRRPLVVITGGEPFRQDLFALVAHLLSQRYEVQIETNGVYGIGELRTLRWSISVVVSPKTSRIHADWDYATAFKYVLTADELDPDDMLPLRALGHKATPRVARPPLGYRGPIYVNPMDEKDTERNAANLRAVAEASLRHGYIAGMQLHKLLELE